MPTDWKLTYGRRTRELDLQPQSPAVAEVPAQPSEAGAMPVRTLKRLKRQMVRFPIALSVSFRVVNVRNRISCVKLIRQKELRSLKMHEMAQYLIDTMNRTANEYNEFIQRKQAWRGKMKR